MFEVFNNDQGELHKKTHLRCNSNSEKQFPGNYFRNKPIPFSYIIISLYFDPVFCEGPVLQQQMFPTLMTTKGIQKGQVTHGSIFNFTPPYTISYIFWYLRYIKVIKQLQKCQMPPCTCPRLAWQLFESFGLCCLCLSCTVEGKKIVFL